MRDFLKSIFHGSPILWAIITLLFIVSGVLMFSAISTMAYKSQNYLQPFYGHLRHLGIGFIAMLGVSRLNYRRPRKWYYILLPLSIIAVIITPWVGVTLNGGARAIRLAGVDVQPQEFVKLFLIMMIADILARYQKVDKNLSMPEELRAKEKKSFFWWITGTVLIASIPIATQNFSTAAMILMLTFIMMFIGRISSKTLWIIFGSGVLFVAILVGIMLILPDEWNQKLPGHSSSIKGRIVTVVEDMKTPDDQKTYVITDENRQPMNAKIAIANGRYPSGPGNSEQRDYLPLAFSDFIFAILVEETGIYGGIALMALYLMILFLAGNLLRRTDNIYPALLAMGLSIMIVMQAFVSICVAVGLGPVTGQPLPLISKGGTSILMTCIMLGMILSISYSIEQEKIAKESQTSEAEKQDTEKQESESSEQQEIQ